MYDTPFVETSINLLNITPQCRKEAETRRKLLKGLYLSNYLRQIHSYPMVRPLTAELAQRRIS